MSLNVDTVLRVMQACDEVEAKPVISLVFPQRGGGTSQVFMEWRRGRTLKDYVRDPILRGKLSLHTVLYSRVLDHNNRVRRSTSVLQPNDEIRVIPVSKGGA